jgi:hypothetical protein
MPVPITPLVVNNRVFYEREGIRTAKCIVEHPHGERVRIPISLPGIVPTSSTRFRRIRMSPTTITIEIALAFEAGQVYELEVLPGTVVGCTPSGRIPDCRVTIVDNDLSSVNLRIQREEERQEECQRRKECQ